jgi:hypothetical protein
LALFSGIFFFMNRLQYPPQKILVFRIALIVAALVILSICLYYSARLDSLDNFGLHQYYERASLYQMYMTGVFLCFVPLSFVLTVFVMSFSYPKQLVETCIDIWSKLPEWVFQGLIPILFCIVSAWTAKEIVGAVPRVFDAFNYYIQAQNFAMGQFYADAPPIPDLFRFPFIIIEDGKWYGSVYPGYSLFLALGVKLGAGWLTSPVLGGLGLMLLYCTAREMFNVSIAKLVAVLGLFSPFFRMMSSIFMAHSAGIVWVTLAIWMLWRWAGKGRDVSVATPFLTGLAIAGLYITRPQAGLVALPLFIGYAVYKVRFCGWKRLMAFAFPVVLAVTFLGYYNYRLTGDFLVNPRYYVDPERSLGFGSDLGVPLSGGHRGGHDLVSGIQNSHLLLTLWNMELFGTGSFGAFGLVSLVILYLLIVKFKNRLAWFLASGIIFNAVLYVFYFTPSPNFGPRYFAEVIPASILLFAWGIFELNKRLPRYTKYNNKPVAVTLFLSWMLMVQLFIVLPVHRQHYGLLPPMTIRDDIHEPDGPAVICVSENVYSMNIYTWNSPNLEGNIFVPLKGVVSFQQIKKAFPDRSVYILDRDDTGKYKLARTGMLKEQN